MILDHADRLGDRVTLDVLIRSGAEAVEPELHWLSSVAARRGSSPAQNVVWELRTLLGAPTYRLGHRSGFSRMRLPKRYAGAFWSAARFCRLDAMQA
jgi:hypothetical protein